MGSVRQRLQKSLVDASIISPSEDKKALGICYNLIYSPRNTWQVTK